MAQDQYLRQDVIAQGDVTLGDDAGDVTTITGTLSIGSATVIPPFATNYGPGPLTNEVLYSLVTDLDDAATVTVTVVDDANDDLYMASFNLAHAGGAAALSSAYGIVDLWGGTNPTFNANYSAGTGPNGSDEVELRMSLADSVSVSVCVDAKLLAAQVSPEISISVQPAAGYSVTAPASQAINLAATTNDGGTLSYQWEVSSDSGLTWANATGGVYLGGTTNALQVSDSTGLNGYQYRCVVSSSGTASDVTSTVCTLTVT